jgi:hypothetical protein
MAYIGVAGNVALVLGTAAYTSCFQTWRFRSIIALTQLLAVFASLTDWVWALRINLRLGLPDVMFAFGEEVFIDAVDALSNQPFFIFAAKLCPNGVEASMFALFMGLSNFGSDAGQYLGASLLKSFGNPVEPEFEGMVPYLMCKSLMRALPILLIPFLVPRGTPADSAAAMGAVNVDVVRAVQDLDAEHPVPPSFVKLAKSARQSAARRGTHASGGAGQLLLLAHGLLVAELGLDLSDAHLGHAPVGIHRRGEAPW